MENLLRQRRRERGLTQQQLAVKLGVNGSRVSELERRPLPARIARLAEAAKALGLQGIDDLIGSGPK